MFITAHITRREWRRVALYALIIIVLTSLPYIIGWAQQGSGWRFGGFLFGVEDGYSYVGKMRLGVRGLSDFYLFYTPEPTTGAPLIFLPYIIPGKIVGLFLNDHDPSLPLVLTLVFQAMRVIFDALYIAVLYRFIAVFLRSPRSRFLALVLATIGGGLGWLLTLVGLGNWLGSAPADFFIPEGFSFLILSGLPHLALARAALLGGLMALMKGIVGKSSEKTSSVIATLSPREGLPYALIATVCWVIVGLAVPFYLVVIDAILGAWGLATWIITRRFPTRLAQVGGLSAVLSMPLALYYFLVFSRNPALAQWSAQNLLPSPNPLQYVAAYILLVIPAVVGGRWAWKKARGAVQSPPPGPLPAWQRGEIAGKGVALSGFSEPKSLRSALFALLIGWPVIVPFLVYLPLNVQRRMAEGVIVPLAILAVAGLRLLARRPFWKRAWRPLVAAACLSSLLLMVGSLFAVLSQSRPLFQPTAEIEALDWLNQHAPADAVVLAGYDTGNVLPAFTDLKPYVGHGPETLFATQKTETTEHFFANQMSADERQSLYGSVNVRYIFYGDVERGLNPQPDAPPNWSADATLIYDQNGYQIYQRGN